MNRYSLQGLVMSLVLAGLFQAVAVEAIVTDARRAGMGGVLLPGRDLEAVNPAWHGMNIPHRRSRAIPLPLGVVAGLLADTEGQDDFESAVTVLMAAFPFAEVELRPEPDISDDIEIDVARDYLRVNLGTGSRAIPDQAIQTDFLNTIGLIQVGVGPAYVGVNGLLVSEGDVDVDEGFRAALKGAEPFTSATNYQGFSDIEGQAAMALELGTAISLGELQPESDNPWAFQVGAAVKGLMGVGYADTRVDLDMLTGDPIFDETNPLEVTYDADLRFNESMGWGYGFDLGVAAVQGPLMLGLSVENIAAQISWTTERRLEELVDGDNLTTIVATGEKVTSKIPAVYIANGAWSEGPWLVAADLNLQQRQVAWHAGVERRFSVLAARGGLSWSDDGGLQGAVGGGVGIGKLSLDVSARTHSYLYSEGRGVYLGASLGLPL